MPLVARKSASAPSRKARRTPAPVEPQIRIPAAGAPMPAGPAIKLVHPVAAKDPRFLKAMDRLQQSSSKVKQHPSAARKTAEAQAAALPPANEKLTKAQANKVAELQEAKTKKPESGSFLEMLRAEIRKALPKKTEDTEDFMKGDDKQKLKDSMTGNIDKQKAEATGEIKSASGQAPDTSKVTGKTVTPLAKEPAPAAPPAVEAGKAMPEPKPETEVSLQQGKKDANKMLADAEVTTGQLQKANDPRFSAVVKAKSNLDQHADAAPQKFRTDEQKTIAQAATLATTDEKKGLTVLLNQRNKSGNQVNARQLTAKEKDEAERKKVTDHIENIFNKTKANVDKKLMSLETEVSDMFDKGSEAAVQKMKDYVEKRFDDRYSGISGKALWVKDKLLPLPDAVKSWFDQSYKIFLNDLDGLVVRVANLVESRIKEAKAEIAQGQKEISDYVKTLPTNLQAVGKAAERDMTSRFNELSQSVDDKKNDLAQNLAQRYKEAFDKGGAALKEMKDAHKSLYERVRDALAEVIKVLREFKTRVMSMLKKSQETIKIIVADPIQFLKNVLKAIGKGLSQFVDNIWKHLATGFMKWLFGSLVETGVTLPPDFSLGSIFKLILQVLGLTYAKIRAKAVKLIGERNVALIEKAWEFIYALLTGGPAALWEKVKEFLGDLKTMLIDAIKDWLISAIIKSAVTKLATMFNPVGAIIQAIIMIYNTMMFFIERIRQIIDFVEAVINSVHKIAIGAIGDAANWIEQALARTVPLIIAFLARLLGLGGITAKVVSFIKNIQTKVDQAIDKMIQKIVAGIEKLVVKGKAAVAATVEWWKQKRPFKTKGGTNHVIFFSGDEKNAIPMIASNSPKPVIKKLDELKKQANNASASEEEKKGKSLIENTLNIATKNPSDPNLVVNMKPIIETYDEGGASKETKIIRKTGSLGGDTVGLEMTVDWLGPKHKIGTPPKSGVQEKLMGLLITDPLEKSPDKYIRGHLLNEHLGGEGDANNMFPITGYANSQHLHSTEKKIKNWVTKPKLWVWYEVKVHGISSKLDTGPKSWNNYVNSTLNCQAILKNAAGKEEDKFSSSIPSIFKLRQKADVTNK